MLTLWAIEHARGGEIFVPKIPSYNIVDVAKAIAPNAELEDIGIRPGEKLHEEMITESDSYNTIDIGKYFAILTANSKKQYLEFYKGSKEVPKGYSYNSGTNDEWLSVKDTHHLCSHRQLRALRRGRCGFCRH